MFLQDALKSGRRIRNVAVGFPFNDWTDIKKHGFSPNEVLSEDWQVEPEAPKKLWVKTEDGWMITRTAREPSDLGFKEFQEIPPGAKVLTRDDISNAIDKSMRRTGYVIDSTLELLGFNE